MIKPIGLNNNSKINSNVSFKAQLVVDISNRDIDTIQFGENGYDRAAGLLQSLRFLKDVAPHVGTDEDVIKISTKPPKDQLFYRDSEGLFISYNGECIKGIGEYDKYRYFEGTVDAIKGIFMGIIDKSVKSSPNIMFDKQGDIVDEISDFRTVV